MGKMKGNRLNTAANLGSLVTGRQQLRVQQQIAGNTSALLAIQMQQAAIADHERLVAHLDRAVASGQMTVEHANARMEQVLYNQTQPAPRPKSRVAPTVSVAINGQLGVGGTPAGWYKIDGSMARYWDGGQWTLQEVPLEQAKRDAKDQWATAPAVIGLQKSRWVAGFLGIFLGMVGVHRFYLGHKGIGILQIAAFVLLAAGTFGLVGLWGVAEGVMILCRAKPFQRDARGVPLA